MSEYAKKSSGGIKQIIVNGAVSVAIFTLILIVTAFIASVLLSFSGQPEIFYAWIKYALAAVAAFAVGRLHIKRKGSNSLYTLIAFAVICLAVLLIVSLAVNGGKIQLLPFVIDAAIVFAFAFLGTFASGNKKKHKKPKAIRR